MSAGNTESSGPPARTNVSREPLTPPPASSSPALAVGVDLVEQERLIRTWERFGDRFLRKVFTATELAQAHGRIQRLAGRFAAKEACAKALGTGIGTIRWHDIEILRLASGKPRLLLHRTAAERARHLGLSTFDVSISDTHEHVLAVVVGAGHLTPPASNG